MQTCPWGCPRESWPGAGWQRCSRHFLGQVPDYLFNVLSNFCSSNSAHRAIAVLLAVTCRLARWKVLSLFLPEPANSQNKDSRAVIPWFLHHPAASDGTASCAGLPQHCAHPKKSPSDRTNPTKPCLWSWGMHSTVLLPATALPASGKVTPGEIPGAEQPQKRHGRKSIREKRGL